MALEHGKLVLQVSEHDALNGSSGGGNSAGAEQAGYGPEHETADTTEPGATASGAPTTLQLSAENGPMPLLVRPELSKLRDHTWSGKPSHEDLAGVDAYGSVLAGVIDLDDSVTEIIGHGLHDCSHVSPNA